VRRLRVGVIYGGRSGEHEISLASAAAIIGNLDRRRYEPVAIRIDRDGRWSIPDRPPTAIAASEVIEQARLDAARPLRSGREVHLVAHPGDETILTIDRTNSGLEPSEGARVTGLGLDVIFPVLHGPYGEDGTIQGLFELANIPYVGAGVLASSVGMDKAAMKVVFAARGLPVVDWTVVLRRRWHADPEAVLTAVLERFTLPVFVKPANLGSSLGISKAKDPQALATAIEVAAGFDRKVIIESAVPDAREIECGVLGNEEPEASVPGEIVPSREFYDYQAKYLDGSSELIIPAPLSDPDAAEIRRLALEAFLAIDAAGMARIDFLVSRDSGRIFLNEINTIPGFTTISMYAKLWAASGVAYPALLDRLIALALDRHADKQQLRTTP
jgi:D-alanine-D-alanine ligase